MEQCAQRRGRVKRPPTQHRRHDRRARLCRAAAGREPALASASRPSTGVTVAWQGLNATVAPAVSCGANHMATMTACARRCPPRRDPIADLLMKNPAPSLPSAAAAASRGMSLVELLVAIGDRHADRDRHGPAVCQQQPQPKRNRTRQPEDRKRPLCHGGFARRALSTPAIFADFDPPALHHLPAAKPDACADRSGQPAPRPWACMSRVTTTWRPPHCELSHRREGRHRRRCDPPGQRLCGGRAAGCTSPCGGRPAFQASSCTTACRSWLPAGGQLLQARHQHRDLDA